MASAGQLSVGAVRRLRHEGPSYLFKPVLQVVALDDAPNALLLSLSDSQHIAVASVPRESAVIEHDLVQLNDWQVQWHQDVFMLQNATISHCGHHNGVIGNPIPDMEREPPARESVMFSTSAPQQLQVAPTPLRNLPAAML
ncbi:unnamed protein product [Effrenium voratum]|uniref:Uncharacterized protein n=1 Tax=Effrenium voratum TaxID=2562239 RepID=A0AA36HR96_9DINO|nr:unnamed protein product [Effrenium voratum]CAJ1429887.1 unnamed protein product [Effrenium voratum]